jgi:hypothetical protein
VCPLYSCFLNSGAHREQGLEEQSLGEQILEEQILAVFVWRRPRRRVEQGHTMKSVARYGRRRLVGLLIAAAGLSGGMGAMAQDGPSKLGKGDPAAHARALSGRWTGTGVAELSTGHREPFSCVMTYILDPGVTELRQGLRCESPNLKVSSLAVMQIKGADLSGTWEEKLLGVKGQVVGSLSSDGIQATVSGMRRQADVTIQSTSACEQIITVAPKPGELVRGVVAQMKRC